MDLQSDLKSKVKAHVWSKLIFIVILLTENLWQSEFLRRIEQSHESISSTMTIFLRRCTLRILNQSSISPLLKHLQKLPLSTTASPSTNHVHHMLTYISKHCAGLFKPHMSELIKAIADEKNPLLVEVGMQALAAVVKTDESLSTFDK